MSAIMDLAKSLVRVPMLYSLYVHARVVGTLLIMPQSRPWGAKEIVPGLFLGNLGDSLQYSALKENGITHVVSVIQSIPSYPYTGYLGVHHRPVHVLDVEEADLLTHLTPTTDYIAAALHGDATPPSTARARAGHPAACTPGVPAGGPSASASASACASAAPGAGGATPNRVLVHCIQGKSRSATVVAAYLMRYLGYTRADAVQAMVQRRPIVDPNPGFLKQLDTFGEHLE